MGNICNEVMIELENAIDLVDKLMKYIIELSTSKNISSSIKFKAYTTIIDLREKIVSARMYIYRYCTED